MSLEKAVNVIGVTAFGGASAINGYLALHSLLNTVAVKAVALQISTQNQIQTSYDVTGDFVSGLLYAAAAGVTGGLAIYFAGRRK